MCQSFSRVAYPGSVKTASYYQGYNIPNVTSINVTETIESKNVFKMFEVLKFLLWYVFILYQDGGSNIKNLVHIFLTC